MGILSRTMQMPSWLTPSRDRLVFFFAILHRGASCVDSAMLARGPVEVHFDQKMEDEDEEDRGEGRGVDAGVDRGSSRGSRRPAPQGSCVLLPRSAAAMALAEAHILCASGSPGGDMRRLEAVSLCAAFLLFLESVRVRDLLKLLH